MIDVTILIVVLSPHYSSFSSSLKSDYQVVWMSSGTTNNDDVVPGRFCCVQKTSEDKGKRKSTTPCMCVCVCVCARAPRGDDCRLNKCISLCLFSLPSFTSLLNRDNTCAPSRSPPEQSQAIGFRGYLNTFAAPIVSHAEFEIYLCHGYSCCVCHVCDRVVSSTIISNQYHNPFPVSLSLCSPLVVFFARSLALSFSLSLSIFFSIFCSHRKRANERTRRRKLMNVQCIRVCARSVQE